ncbi:MAG: hydroxysqualene dehydroxylase HpnE [Caulobacterales bacterium]|jgi:squalene-associated FAD-dependent desaturase
MASGTVHVVGAGLAGLAAATALAEAGVAVEVSEAAAQAGGRCRSYFDPQLGLTIDNGNHLVLSGNPAVHEYLTRLGASAGLAGPDEAEFAFFDAASGEAWTIRPNASPLAWWILDPRRNVPGARLGDYLAILPLMSPPPGRRVDQVIACRGPVWDRLMRPFLLAALNTEPEAGSAELAARVIRETLARGGGAYRPRIASPTLAAAFVEPAQAYLASRGARLHLGRRLKALEMNAQRVTGLAFSDGRVDLGPDDRVILATPPTVTGQLYPGLVVPDAFQAIVNGHFRTTRPAGAPPIMGVLGATVEWIFCFEDRISVTISGAERLVRAPREALAAQLWTEVGRALGLTAPLPAWQIVTEKRATFSATPAQNRRRPQAATPLANLLLAGDWTQTHLPATIEGAIRSGFRAAALARKSLGESR